MNTFRGSLLTLVLVICDGNLIANPPAKKGAEIGSAGVPYGTSFTAKLEYAPGGIKDLSPYRVLAINGKEPIRPLRWGVSGWVGESGVLRGYQAAGWFGSDDPRVVTPIPRQFGETFIVTEDITPKEKSK